MIYTNEDGSMRVNANVGFRGAKVLEAAGFVSETEREWRRKKQEKNARLQALKDSACAGCGHQPAGCTCIPVEEPVAAGGSV